MNPPCYPIPPLVAAEMLEIIARSVCDRPGESRAQTESRTQQMVHSVVGLSPRDGLELKMAGTAYGQFDLALELMRDIHRGTTLTEKLRAVSGIVALNRSAISLMREFRGAQTRPLAAAPLPLDEAPQPPADQAQPDPAPAPAAPAQATPMEPTPMEPGLARPAHASPAEAAAAPQVANPPAQSDGAYPPAAGVDQETFDATVAALRDILAGAIQTPGQGDAQWDAAHGDAQGDAQGNAWHEARMVLEKTLTSAGD